ncbi:MAG: hydrogenase maturation protease [Blastococcus sp.]
MSPPRAVVIGVGNEFRQDDGVGPSAVALLRSRVVPGLRLIDSDGQPTQLLDAWANAELAIVVDAARSEPPAPGRIHRLLLRPASSSTVAGVSTHGLGLADTVALAEVLGRAPRRLVVFGVEAARTGYGRDLTPDVRAALPRVVDAVLAELGIAPREGGSGVSC